MIFPFFIFSLTSPTSSSMRRTHLLFGNFCLSAALDRMSVQVAAPPAASRVWRTASRNASYGWSVLGGTFQYGLLHLGHTFGSLVSARGTHSWEHRSHRYPMSRISTLVMNPTSRSTVRYYYYGVYPVFVSACQGDFVMNLRQQLFGQIRKLRNMET